MTDTERRARHAARMREWNAKNRDRVSEQRRARRLANIEARQEQGKAYRARNKDHINAVQRANYARNVEEKRAKSRAYRVAAKARGIVWGGARKHWDRRQRLAVLTYYSRGRMDCECCGTIYLPHLTIDHIAQNGASERRAMREARASGKSGVYSMGFYASLVKRGYPAGYRVLCFNCNKDAWYNRGDCGCQEARAAVVGTHVF